jgi:malonate decarboxylase gamma subunit
VTLDDVLASLFPTDATVEKGPHGILRGAGRLPDGTEVALAGVVDGTPLGVDGARRLAGHVLSAIGEGGRRPIVLLIDTASQTMARRDELLGLNEYLAHLAKSLVLAAARGHHTVGILYGRAAAGAFIASALSTRDLVALPGAEPSVMDLPSIARITKLPLERLAEMARSTPIFAPGLDPLYAIGAVAEIWDPGRPLSDQLIALLKRGSGRPDERDDLGLRRQGRLLARDVARRVAAEGAGG